MNHSPEEVREVYGTVGDDVVIVHPVHVFEYSYDTQNYEVHKQGLGLGLLLVVAQNTMSKCKRVGFLVYLFFLLQIRRKLLL